MLNAEMDIDMNENRKLFESLTDQPNCQETQNRKAKLVVDLLKAVI